MRQFGGNEGRLGVLKSQFPLVADRTKKYHSILKCQLFEYRSVTKGFGICPPRSTLEDKKSLETEQQWFCLIRRPAGQDMNRR